jgi:hypothetical protein
MPVTSPTYQFSDAQYDQIKGFLPKNGHRGGQWKDHRLMIDGIRRFAQSQSAAGEDPQLIIDGTARRRQRPSAPVRTTVGWVNRGEVLFHR